MLGAMTVVIGLSGGIGAGKSTVGHLLEKLGATLVDADAIVHEKQAPGSPMLDELARAFGPEIIDASGALDRKALADRVFRDPEARARLGRIVHPPVIAEMMKRAAAAIEAGVPMVVLDIPLLFEGQKTGTGSAAHMQFDATVAVWVPQAVQIERTVARDGCTPEEAKRRVAAQLPIDEKRDMADHVIDNSGSPAETEAQVTALYRKLVGGEESGDARASR
jgi:dephospho-CoA kinase